MEITVDTAEGAVPVTILRIQGDLDSSSFQLLIDKAAEVCDAGAKHLVIDMSGVPFMGSAGLVALYSVAKLAKGQESARQGAGGDWNAYPAMGATRDKTQRNVKLLGVQEQVQGVLDVSGMAAYFEIHCDLDEAVASF